MLTFIKMTNGEEVIGDCDDQLDMEADEDESQLLMIKNPILVAVDPIHGIYARSWLLFGDTESVVIPDDVIMFAMPASVLAQEYYANYVGKMSERKQASTDEAVMSMLEGNGATKH